MAKILKRNPALDGKYLFEYDVGQWTFGTMQVVKERETGTMKTCKIVKKSLLQSSTFEAKGRLNALVDLRHPHICSITDVLEDKDHIYIVTDFYQGGDIQDWMDRMDENNWLQEDTCAAYIRQAILALTYCQGLQVYHGDLRPSNLLLTSKMPDSEVKVSDFGIAGALDPEGRLRRAEPNRFGAPEALQLQGGPSDIWSIGAIANALLTGQPPDESARGEIGGWMARRRSGMDDEAWGERSEFARDFVKRCLRQRGERPTAPKLLWHPWVKGIAKLGGPQFHTDNEIARELRHKSLCYSLAVLLLPAVVPYNDFARLREAFEAQDADQDGFVDAERAQRILLQRCNHREAILPALAIVDVAKTEVLDLCAISCADLIVREFFAAGPTHAPLVGPFSATDLAGRMVKLFFDNFGDRRSPSAATTSVQILRAKLRTATGRDLEAHTSVRYDELLDCLPEEGRIDAQMLTTKITHNACRGTPLGNEGDDLSPIKSDSPWGIAGGSPFGLDVSSIFQTCGMGSRRGDDSPHSIRIA
mmetsp:Transcript_65334/g.199983  ORF Transcript_65334/g.199983 Transcript_65334/m.199983 type:complete len:532 (-) Transcript_65334:20-1615(-)